MASPLSKMLLAAIVIMTSINTLQAQYIDAYNKSGTGPNTNRGAQEAANKAASRYQEQMRHEQYEADRKAAKNNPSETNPEKTKTTVPAKKTTELKKADPLSKYDDVWENEYGLSRVTLNGKFGFINNKQKEVIPLIYDEASIFEDELAMVRKGDKFGFIDEAGNEVVRLIYDEVYFFSGGLAAVRIGDKFGFVDKNGKTIIPLKYDHVSSFISEITAVSIGDKETYINKMGLALFPLKYNSLKEPINGLIEARLDGSVGYLNMAGKEIIPVKYDSVIYLVEDGKKMYLNGDHYYFDKNGKPMKDVYDWVDDYNDYGLFSVSLNDKFGKINVKSKVIIPVIYEDLISGDKEFVGIKKNGKWGYVNRLGKEVIPPKFDTILENFNKKGLAIVQKNGETFSINRAGLKVGSIAKQKPVQEKKIIVSEPAKEVKSDKKNPSPFADKYGVVSETSQGLAAVYKDGKWGYINTKGVVVIPLKYDYAGAFEKGIAIVLIGDLYTGKWGFINLKGNEVTPIEYDEVRNFSNGLAAVLINYKWGYVNEQGVMVIQPQFDSGMAFNDKGIAEVIIKEEYYLIDKTGKILGKR